MCLILYFCCFNIVSFHSPFSHYCCQQLCSSRHSLSRPRFNYLLLLDFRLFLIFKAVMNILEHMRVFPLLGYFLGTNAFLEVEILESKFMNTFMALETCAKLLLKVQFRNTLKLCQANMRRVQEWDGVPIPGNSMQYEGALASTDLCDLSLECHNMTTTQRILQQITQLQVYVADLHSQLCNLKLVI